MYILIRCDITTYRDCVDQRTTVILFVGFFDLVQVNVRSTHYGPDQSAVVGAVAFHCVIQQISIVVCFRGGPLYCKCVIRNIAVNRFLNLINKTINRRCARAQKITTFDKPSILNIGFVRLFIIIYQRTNQSTGEKN